MRFGIGRGPSQRNSTHSINTCQGLQMYSAIKVGRGADRGKK